MTETRRLKSARLAASKAVAFFNAPNKQYRERWVVRSFLRNLGVKFHSFDLKSPTREPPDVLFRRASFEVKEVLDSNRKRHREYKEYALRLSKARSTSEMVELFDPVGIRLSQIASLLDEQVAALRSKYTMQVRETLDLLFYINLNHVFDLVLDDVPDLSRLRLCGFRSVSFLQGGSRSYVLTAASDAPAFLLDNVGRLAEREAES